LTRYSIRFIVEYLKRKWKTALLTFNSDEKMTLLFEAVYAVAFLVFYSTPAWARVVPARLEDHTGWACSVKLGRIDQSGRSADYCISPSTVAAVLIASSAAGKPAYTTICRIISKISLWVQPIFDK
jgi:hypothetical protein